HIARLPDEQVRELYPKFRWRILESTFIGYATFYLVRNNLPVVSKEMGQALHYSKSQIGDLLALTALCNFAFGAVSSYPVHLALWTMNGVAQGMGWAPCGRSLGHWYSARERG